MKKIKLKKDEVLVLRRNGEGNKSGYDTSFTYPDKGYVEAKDWKDSGECGYGLHGWTKYFEEYTDTTLYIEDLKVKYKYTYTPDNITKLKDHEVFVFGSNLNGNHAGGSAKLAQDKFGAESGVGEGLTGQSYAFPTLDKDMQKVSLDDIKQSAERLFKCATDNTRTIFFLTKIGCGIAGFSEEEIKPYFVTMPANVIKPKDW
jgi:hypothetical protein